MGIGEQKSESSFGMIKSTLGVGSIRITVSSRTNKGEIALVLERELEGDTRVIVDGVRDHINQIGVTQIEVFSQGDLQRIAEDPNRRLNLIDRLHIERINELATAREESASNLRILGDELRKTRTRIAALRQELQPAPRLVEELKAAISASPELSPEIEAERQAFDKRARTLTAITQAIEAVAHARRFLEGAPRFTETIDAALCTVVEQGRTEANQLSSLLRDRCETIRDFSPK